MPNPIQRETELLQDNSKISLPVPDPNPFQRETEPQRDSSKMSLPVPDPIQQETKPEQDSSKIQILKQDTLKGHNITQAKSHISDQDWEVITENEADTLNYEYQRAGGHMDLTLGWGRWKYTVFSTDWSITTHTHYHEPDNSAPESKA
ncbi:hypothetical protein FQN57_001684 [Myotisia sp. PD_48]|nr:hypothetical protein FQN57_001684 [Myotisia sp. PD_48]